MIKVLVISKILPISDLTNKKAENDILLVTEKNITANAPNIKFTYVFPVPDTNKFLSKISLKWESYYNLKKKKTATIGDAKIYALPIVLLPIKLKFRDFLYELSIKCYSRRIQKVVKDFAPTVIHAQNSDLEAYIAKWIGKKYNIPYIVTLRELPNKPKSDRIIRSNLESAKHLIAISPTQKRIAKNYTKKPINLIPHGISENFFVKNNLNSESESSEYIFKFVTACKLIKLKNVERTIRSLAQFSGDFIFDIYGEGPEKDNLMKLTEELNLSKKISFKGFVEHQDLPKIFPLYNLFIMPSFPETLGRVYFEAMACGTPVIAVKKTGIDGLISNEKEGFLIDLEKEDSILNVLKFVAENRQKLKTMSLNALTFAKDHSWENISKEYIKLYSQQ